MLRIVLLLAVSAVCLADLPVTPPQTPKVSCGYIPTKILGCIGNPNLVTRDVTAQCTSKTNECDRINCIFKKSDWMDGDAIDKARLTAYFEQFAKDHPAWAPAINQVKTSCLAGNLPAQGAYVGCRAYDIMHCVLTAFFRNAQPSQWSTSEECTESRQYAAVCPICPDTCFAPAIPYGSCNACRLLPTTP